METQALPLSDLLLAEVLSDWSRDKATLGGVAGTAYPVGTVLAQASGVYSPVTASTTANAVAVLIEPGVAGPVPATVIRRGAVVSRSALVWPDTATGPQITAGEAALTALDIVVRDTL